MSESSCSKTKMTFLLTHCFFLSVVIVNQANSGAISKLKAKLRLLELIQNNTNCITIRLLQCVKVVIDTLPKTSQGKEVKEFEFRTRFLQLAPQKLLDTNEYSFKWINTICTTDTNNSDNNHSRPDGIVESDSPALGYFEAKPIEHAKQHRKINIDLYRLYLFANAGSAKHKANYMFELMAIGTNIRFFISRAQGDVFVVDKLDYLRLSLSLDELRRFIPYLDRLHHTIECIHSLCYAGSTSNIPSSFGKSLEPKAINKVITERSADRSRPNCFYMPCH
ncbi:hypothetical protein MBANPS3_010994 [Mucor bainieri]